MNKIKKSWQYCSIILLLSACSSYSLPQRYETAQGIATQASLARHATISSPFTITSYERFTRPNIAANIYIEGDGLAWINKSKPSPDPTPRTPTALKLAAQDKSANVAYIARPCQYTSANNGTNNSAISHCPRKYWTSHRFAPEVIDAMNQTLNDIKARHNIKGFNLIGFSGGGAVAVLLAAGRNDVLSLRTVAGNLDHKTLHNIHGVSQLSTKSLNPVEVAQDIAHIPQLHFIGGKDKIVPQAIYKSFYEASGRSPCIKSSTISKAGHNKLWPEIWQGLLKAPINCQ